MGSSLSFEKGAENEDFNQSEYHDSEDSPRNIERLLSEIDDLDFLDEKQQIVPIKFNLELELLSEKRKLLINEYHYFECKLREGEKNLSEIESLIRFAELRIRILALESECSFFYNHSFEDVSIKYYAILRELKAIVKVFSSLFYNLEDIIFSLFSRFKKRKLHKRSLLVNYSSWPVCSILIRIFHYINWN